MIRSHPERTSSPHLSHPDLWLCARCCSGFTAPIGRALFHTFTVNLGPSCVLSPAFSPWSTSASVNQRPSSPTSTVMHDKARKRDMKRQPAVNTSLVPFNNPHSVSMLHCDLFLPRDQSVFVWYSAVSL